METRWDDPLPRTGGALGAHCVQHNLTASLNVGQKLALLRGESVCLSAFPFSLGEPNEGHHGPGCSASNHQS